MSNSIPDMFARGLRDARIALLGAALAFLIPARTNAQTPSGQHELAATNATHSEQPNSPNSAAATQPTPDSQAAKAKAEEPYYSSTTDKVKYPGLGPGGNQKVETTIGPVKARLYGTVLLNISISDSAEVGQDIPLWPLPGAAMVMFPDGTTQRAGTLHDTIFTARQSIFGFTFDPAKAAPGEWSPSALVEFDFFGSRPSDGLQPQGRVFNQPRLRKGYFQLQKDTWKILAGQDNIIISPLDPVSLSHVAVPLGATAGDLWGRFPQVRVEKTAAHGDFSTLMQFGILRPDFGDPRLGDLVASGSSVDSTFSGFGERATQPFYQARVAVSHPLAGSTATVGIGGHYGREKLGATRNLDSWAFAFDYDIPVISRVTLRGEGFVGSNLVPFQGGILQGVAALSASPTGNPPLPFTTAHKIGAGGGWGELTFRLTDDNKNFFYIGAGTDDPRNHQLLPGTTRAKNTFAWASYFRKLTNNVTLATEWSNWQFRTLTIVGAVQTKAPSGRGNVFNIALAYQF